MTKFFCADSSRQAEEDIIGSGTNYQTYILVECRPPWAAEAFDSKYIPQNLKDLVGEIKLAKLSVRFLLINSGQLKSTKDTKLLIYERERDWLSNGYRRKEFNVEAIEQVATVVRQYLNDEAPDCESEESEINQPRDILVCTHGRHDKCCAKYGNPFYFQSLATISHLGLSNVRLWQTSHFGGHRFAPTAIDLPDGRYYGVLDRESFESILTRAGDIKCLNKVYRGWGILPTSIQALERELIFRYGWDWFNYKVAGKITEQNSDKSSIKAEITFEKPDGAIHTYRAELVKDESKTLRLKGSCDTTKESEFIKYSVENLHLDSESISDFEKHEYMRNVKVVKGGTPFRKSESFVKFQSSNPSH
jgi:hypothetical protein